MIIFMLCLQVFFSRILDVSLGVIRTILSVKGKSFYASLIGFFEVLLWFLVVRNALSSDVGGLYVALAYALGFATGTFIGGFLSRRLIKTRINVQVITSTRDENLLKEIRISGFPATIIKALGSGEVKSERYLLFIEIESTNFKRLKTIILNLDKHAFIFVNELTQSINGFFFDKK